jgi:tetratricopeptide (TPR) repeat protein
MRKILFFVTLIMLASPLFAGEGSEEVYLRDGSNYLAAGNYLRAAKAFENAINLNPRRADAYAGLGMSFMKHGLNEAMTIPEMLEKALAAFNRSLEINPDNADVRYNLGMIHLALDQKDYALRQHDKLHLLDKQKAGALLATRPRSISETIRYVSPYSSVIVIAAWMPCLCWIPGQI